MTGSEDKGGVLHRLDGPAGEAPARPRPGGGPRRRPGKPGGKGLAKPGGKPAGAGQGKGAVPMRPAQGAAAHPAPPPPDVVIEIASPAATARMRRAIRRRKALSWLVFIVMVVAPTGLAGWYLFTRAADQYVSEVSFAVRSPERSAASPVAELFGGAVDSAGADSLILYEYLQSQPLVDRIDGQLDLREIYRKPDGDPLFRFGDDPAIEELVDYWNLAQTFAYDSGAGIVYAEIRAFDPQDAYAVAQAVTAESERLVNSLSAKSRDDAIAFALTDLAQAEARVREVRLAMQAFRGQAGTADVSLDIRAAMELVTELRARRAELAADYDARRELLGAASPVLLSLKRQLSAMDAQIRQEEERIASAEDGARPGSLAEAAGRQEELMVELQFAENMYTSALAAVDAARAEARRSQRYLAIHIAPTMADAAEHPRRYVLTGAVFVLSLVLWAIARLIYAGIRDRA